MTTYGYIRKKVPSETTKQLQEVMRFDCEDIYIEEESLEIDTELEKMLNRLESHDTLIVESVCSFGKSSNELNHIFERLFSKNIHLISRQESLDTHDSCCFYELTQLIFKVNKECSSRVVKQRIALSKEKGHTFGRPPLNHQTIKEIKSLYRCNKLSMRAIAEKCNVSLGTVHKYVTEAEQLIHEVS